MNCAIDYCERKQSTSGKIAKHVVRIVGLVALTQYNTYANSLADTGPSDLRTRKTGDDWPAFLGPRGDSKSRETGIRGPWPNNGPPIIWMKNLGSGYGIGSTSRGRFFQLDRRDAHARLQCFHAETGKLLWNFKYQSQYRDLYGYNNGPRCSPVIDGNRVYILGVEGMLHCLQVEDGQLLWKRDTNADFGVAQNFFGVGSTPVVFENFLLAMIGGSPADDQSVPPGQLNLVSGNGTGIVAFDKKTGKTVYQITDELASYASIRIVHRDNRPWAFAFARGGLVAFNPATGKVDFRYPWRADILESVNASTPVIHRNQIFISETYKVGSSLLAFSPEHHEVLWRDPGNKRQNVMMAHWNTPIFHDGYLYGCSGRNTPDADLRCVRWSDGKLIWKQSVDSPRGTTQPHLTRCSLLYVDNHFVCLGEYGVLRLIRVNPEKYELVSKVTLSIDGPTNTEGQTTQLINYPAWSAPVLSHGLLYVRGAGRLVCMELISEE